MPPALNPKSAAILELIAQGHSYDQILARQPDLTYPDIFAAAREALNVIENLSLPNTHVSARTVIPDTRPAKAWSAEDDARLASLSKQGRSLTAIASQLQRQPNEIRDHLKTLHIPKPPAPKTEPMPKPEPAPKGTKPRDTHLPARQGLKWTPEEDALLRDLFEKGTSDADIAEQLQRSPGGINARIDKLRNEQSGGNRVLGLHPKDNRAVELLSGHFGPYVKHGSTTVNVPRTVHPGTITLEHALQLLAGEYIKS